MLVVTETMFVKIMRDYSSHTFSKDALKLIYEYYNSQKNFHVEFREMDIEIAFNEESYLDCVNDKDILIEEVDEATLDAVGFDAGIPSEKIDLIKSTISDFFDEKGIWVGFTSTTVVYESSR